VVDLIGLGLSAGAVGKYITPLPFLAVAGALLAAALLPSPAPKGSASRGRQLLVGMIRRVVLVAGIGAAWMYFWELPARCLWLGPIWLGVVGVAQWKQLPLLSWVRASVSWIERYVSRQAASDLRILFLGVADRFRRSVAWIERHRTARAESGLRAFLLAVMSIWLMRGFNAPYLQGGGDSGWYGAVLADAMAQTRAGVFPMWAGQSAYQFNGSISPMRIAPAFTYAGALLDTATFHSLAPVSLLNLLLTVVAFLATFCAYLCLVALLPQRRWLAAGLAALFMACPGVLGIAYNGDLYMSWMALPLVPFVFLGTVLSFRPEREKGALLMLGASLGLCWWAHSPIALWATALAGAAQLARIAARRGKDLRLGEMLAAALLFLAIAAYPVGSVLLYPPVQGEHMSSVQLALPKVIVEFVQGSFPGALLPMSAVGRQAGDVQFGYALWALLIFCFCCRYRGGRLEVRILLIEAAFLAVLLLPIPGISLLAWSIVPGFIRNPTGNWAAPRLYLAMAAATVFALAAGSGAAPDGRPRRGGLLAALVIGGCVWSLLEAAKFAGESRLVALDAVARIDKVSPENLQLTRYSYGMFPGLPSTFTHGVTDPSLENHILSRDASAPILENAKVAFASSKLIFSTNLVKRRHGDTDFIELGSPLHIEPGKSYLLQLVIDREEYASGVIQIKGREFFREYGLPEHGGPRAFGVGGSHLGVIPIWTTKGSPENLMLRFFPSAPLTLDQGLRFASEARLLQYEPDALPVRVDSWIPYSARVRSPAESLLETPRMFQPGYEALVDGKPAPVSKSPDGFVCVAVPAGESHVTLSYEAPAGLRALFWLSFAGIAGAVAAASAWLLAKLAAGVRPQTPGGVPI
jgi:hypothetical protein